MRSFDTKRIPALLLLLSACAHGNRPAESKSDSSRNDAREEPELTPASASNAGDRRASHQSVALEPDAHVSPTHQQHDAELRANASNPTGAADATESGDESVRTPDVMYVPTPQPIVDKMLQVAKLRKGDVVYDLGCGDGRIVVTAAKRYGVEAYGFDVDANRIAEARENVRT